MGHCVGYLVMSKDAEYKDVCKALSFAYDPHESMGYHGQMTVHKGKIYQSREEAEEAIKLFDRGFYDDHAVLFHENGNGRASKKTMEEIKRKEKLIEELTKFENSVRIRTTFKSATVGCKKCGSKVNKDYVKDNNKCPVCGETLESATTIERRKSFKSRIAEANARIAECERKDRMARNKDDRDVALLVKYEYHC